MSDISIALRVAARHQRLLAEAEGSIERPTPSAENQLQAAGIAKITKAYIRTYTDSGQVTAYVEWVDTKGKAGRTEGKPDSLHMKELFNRAKREGVHVTTEKWATENALPLAAGGGFHDIKPGDRVTIKTPHGQEVSGRAVMKGPHGWVLNLGGPHGRPGIATPENVVKVKSMGAKQNAWGIG